MWMWIEERYNEKGRAADINGVVKPWFSVYVKGPFVVPDVSPEHRYFTNGEKGFTYSFRYREDAEIFMEQRRLASLETVSDKSAAWELFYERLGDEDYIDNQREAFVDDPVAYAEYERILRQGCCGSFDMSVYINGREFIMGCNYGH